MFVVVIGEFVGGYKFVGPYKTPDDAVKEVKEKMLPAGVKGGQIIQIRPWECMTCKDSFHQNPGVLIACPMCRERNPKSMMRPTSGNNDGG